MPYIKPEDREDITNGFVPETPGTLNYFITCAIKAYLELQGVSYTSLNEVIGVLECAKLELYRRMVSPYEDQKIKENGDVY